MSTEREGCSVSLKADYQNNVESINGLDSRQNTTAPGAKPQNPRRGGRNLLWFNVLRIVVILVVSVPLTLPIILFHLPHQKGQSGVEEKCSETLCSPENYSGTTCQMELQYWQSCYSWTQNDSRVLIPAERQQEVQEQIAQHTFTVLQLLSPKEECIKVFKPFMCLLLFGLCDGSGQEVQPSYQECVAITSDHCAEEVQLALSQPDTSELFPNCTSLEPNTCSNNSTKEITDTQNTSCSEGFYFDEDSVMCIPECGVWSIHSATADKAITVIFIVGVAIGVIVNTAVLLITIIQHKRMLKFPSIFISYHCVSLLVYSSVDFVSRVNKRDTVCSSRNLLEYLEDENLTSYFCSLIGGLFVYVGVQVVLWWFFHTSVIFWGIMQPFKYRQMRDQGKLKYIHLTMLVAGLLLPLIPTLICYWIGGFKINPLLHYSCHPTNKFALRYSLYVPLNILVIIAVGLLLFIFTTFALEKYGHLKKASRPAEMKLLIIICSFFALTLYIMTTIALIDQKRDEFKDDLSAYFVCEAGGKQDCSKDNLDTNYAIINITIYIGFVNMTLIYFIYIIDINMCKRTLNRMCSKD